MQILHQQQQELHRMQASQHLLRAMDFSTVRVACMRDSVRLDQEAAFGVGMWAEGFRMNKANQGPAQCHS